MLNYGVKKYGNIATSVGSLVVLFAFTRDTAPEGTHNIGLMQSQIMLFQFGGLVCLVGVLCLITASVLSRFESAGIIPPTE